MREPARLSQPRLICRSFCIIPRVNLERKDECPARRVTLGLRDRKGTISFYGYNLRRQPCLRGAFLHSPSSARTNVRRVVLFFSCVAFFVHSEIVPLVSVALSRSYETSLVA